MRSLSTREVMKRHSSVAQLVGAGEPVRVTKRGRTAYYMMPPSADVEFVAKRAAAARFIEVMDAAKTSAAAQALSDDDLANLLDAHA